MCWGFDPLCRCSIDVHCRRVAGGISSETRANSFLGTCILRSSRGPRWDGFVYPDSLISWFSGLLPEGLPAPLVGKGPQVRGQGLNDSLRYTPRWPGCLELHSLIVLAEVLLCHNVTISS